jgi:hypothetical protein
VIPAPSEILLVTAKVVAAFEALQIPYLIAGSVASGVYGDPRSTRDIDFVAAIKPPGIEPFVRALGEGFYLDIDLVQDAVRDRRSFNLIHLDTMAKVDIFVAKDDAFTRSQLARRSKKTLSTEPPFSAFLASAEDTVLAKLQWYRAGNEVSDNQWNDVLGVLKIQGPAVDLAYLRNWAAALELSDLLDRALQEAEPDE